MSAYVCNHDTIDLLASFVETRRDFRCSSEYIKHLVIDPAARAVLRDAGIGDGVKPSFRSQDAELVADLLYTQNVRSVRDRYADNKPEEMIPDAPYRFRRVSTHNIRNLAAVVLQSCRCLTYQSCETDDFSDTLAHHLIEAIVREATDALAAGVDAPWGWTREWQKTADDKIRATVRQKLAPLTR